MLFEQDAQRRRITRYVCNHVENKEYLYKEFEPKKYEYLSKVDDGSPTIFCTKKDILGLLNDLMIAVSEAKSNGIYGIQNHLKEIIVLCKFVIWSEYRYWIEFSPFGFPMDIYPTDLPDALKMSLPDDL